MSQWIYLYDEDASDLRTAERQLSRYGIDQTLMRSFCNRIDLFEAIDARESVAVALIDLQSDERSDSNYSGHRLIETIRRHDRLRERCAPIAYTVHVRDDVVALACGRGACGLISKTDLDAPAAERAGVDLIGFLDELRRRPLPHYAGAADCTAERFPRFPAGVQLAKERLQAQQARLLADIESVLASIPRIVRRPYFWQAIRYFADGTDPASVARWIVADYDAAKQRTVELELDALRNSLAPRYTVHGADMKAFARDLLKRAPHKRRALTPDDMDSLRVLQRVSVLGDVLRSSDLRAESYLDGAALSAVDRVVDPLTGVERPPGKVGASRYTEDLLERLSRIEPDEQMRKRLQVELVRGVTNMYDTYLAHEARAA
jgi:hypothetical protein